MPARTCRGGALGLAALLAVALAPSVSAEPVGSAEAAIRKTLAQWTADFNDGRSSEVCKLFALELRYDYRGFPERSYDDICALLQELLTDLGTSYVYELQVNEVMVSGDLAAVRLVWTLIVKRRGDLAGTITKEPGLDIFRRQRDGSWKIVRYLAFEE